MNLPSYNTEQDNSNKISTKRIPKWILPAIAVLIIISIAVGAFMFYQNSNSNNNGEESEYTPDYENDQEYNIGLGGAPELGDIVNEPDDFVVEDEPIEVDWEEPPVATIYNEEADLNSDGHVEKSEWEAWVAEHPEDLNQDLIIEEAERDAYESTDEAAQSEYKPLDPTDPDFGVISQEELDEINEEGRELAEENGMGLAGLEDWSNNSGVPSNEYQGGTKNPDGTYTNPDLEA